MKALIIYHSYFGNTKKVAEEYQKQLMIPSVILPADDVTEKDIIDKDFILIGSPTRAFNMVKPIKQVVKKFKANFEDKLVLSFDTRADITEINSKLLSWMIKRFGYAAEKIDKLLVKYGAKLLETGKWYYVKDSEGPITEESFLAIKKDIEGVNKLLETIE